MNESDLGTALRDRVADVHPDLDRLLATSVRAGSRIRRRRRAGASVTAVAGLAVVAGGAALIGGSGAPQPVADPRFASEPTRDTTACAVISLPASPTAEPSAAVPLAPGECVTASGPALLPQNLPVHPAARSHGWACDLPADDKLSCRKGRYSATVVVRPRDELGSWSTPDRPADQVGLVLADYFVTIQPGPGTPGRALRGLRDSLRYNPFRDGTVTPDGH